MTYCSMILLWPVTHISMTSRFTYNLLQYNSALTCDPHKYDFSFYLWPTLVRFYSDLWPTPVWPMTQFDMTDVMNYPLRYDRARCPGTAKHSEKKRNIISHPRTICLKPPVLIKTLSWRQDAILRRDELWQAVRVYLSRPNTADGATYRLTRLSW